MIVGIDHAAAEFRKQAETPVDAERLAREARILALARHPGVVPLLGFDGTTLRLRLIDGAAPACLGPDAAVALATTLADLHDIGVVHGAVGADHVVFDGSGGPVLCGFGTAATGLDSRGPEAAADVAALATFLLAATGDPAVHEVAARPRAARRRAPSARRLAEQLATAAAAATPAEPPTEPPRRARPATGGPAAPAEGAGDPRRRRRRRTGAVLAAGALAVAAVVAGVVAMAVNVAPARGGPATPACPPVDQGCRPVPRPDGAIAGARGRRYRIGGPGDLVVLGRWHCHAALPALLVPATGEVWVWDAWAASAASQPARLVARIPGAVSVQVEPRVSGCDGLLVRRARPPAVAVLP